MATPANDIYPKVTPSPPPSSPLRDGPAKALGILLLLVQAAQIIALIFLIGVALLSLFGAVDTQAMTAKSVSPGGHLGIILYAIGSVITMIAVVWHLRKLVNTLRMGDPFVPQNAVRLRYIWIILGAAELARTLILPFLERASTAGDLDFDIRAHVWFFVLILIVLAQVFREGARLRAEAQLTV